MRYGFKAQAERISAQYRSELGLTLTDPFPAKCFLERQGVLVWTPRDVPGVEPKSINQLVAVDPDSWSGLTVQEAGGTVVIVNPTHPEGRRANTLMHEWAHLHLRHSPKRVDITLDGVLLVSDYEKADEEEADWLAGAMLVPRDGLLSLMKAGLAVQQIAQTFAVSSELTEWRVRMTGIKKQLRMR